MSWTHLSPHPHPGSSVPFRQPPRNSSSHQLCLYFFPLPGMPPRKSVKFTPHPLQVWIQVPLFLARSSLATLSEHISDTICWSSSAGLDWLCMVTSRSIQHSLLIVHLVSVPLPWAAATSLAHSKKLDSNPSFPVPFSDTHIHALLKDPRFLETKKSLPIKALFCNLWH